MKCDRRQLMRSMGALGALAVSLPVLGQRVLSGAPVAADGPEPPQTSPAVVGERPATTQLTREEVLQAVELKARQSLGPHGNCAQTSFAVLQERFSLPGDQFHRALSPFPGIGFRGETCGAVVGSLMALGLVFGYSKEDQAATRKATYLKAQELCRRFEEAQGSTTCRDIQTASAGRWYNLLDPAEAQAFREAGGPQGCQNAVADAVRIAAELILAGSGPISQS